MDKGQKSRAWHRRCRKGVGVAGDTVRLTVEGPREAGSDRAGQGREKAEGSLVEVRGQLGA